MKVKFIALIIFAIMFKIMKKRCCLNPLKSVGEPNKDTLQGFQMIIDRSFEENEGGGAEPGTLNY